MVQTNILLIARHPSWLEYAALGVEATSNQAFKETMTGKGESYELAAKTNMKITNGDT